MHALHRVQSTVPRFLCSTLRRLPWLSMWIFASSCGPAFCDPPQASSPPDEVLFPEDAASLSLSPSEEDPAALFEQEIFGGTEGISPARRRARGEERLYLALEQRCQQIQKTYELPDEQLDKLRLAGRGDIQRFLSDVDSTRTEYLQGVKNPVAQQQSLKRIRSLRSRANGGVLCGSSLFASVLRGITRDRSHSPPQESAARQAFAQSAQFEQAVAYLDRRVPITQQQRETLLSLLIATNHRNNSDSGTASPAPGSMNPHQILEILTTLSDDAWRPHFSDEQWQAFHQELQRAGLPMGIGTIGR